MKRIAVAFVCLFTVATLARAEIIVAEGEQFTPKDAKGWKVTSQDDSYGSHTYGGMWMTHGGCLGARRTASARSPRKTRQRPRGGKYRVWSKYQAPPYFNYLHRIEIVQNGKTVYLARLRQEEDAAAVELHAASATNCGGLGRRSRLRGSAERMVARSPGAAEMRLVTVANATPAGQSLRRFRRPDDESQGRLQGLQALQGRHAVRQRGARRDEAVACGFSNTIATSRPS